MQTTTQSLLLFLLSTTASLLEVAVAEEGYCSAPSSTVVNVESNSKPLYWKVTNPTLSPSHLADLPGFTRSIYKRDHALITPESHVFSPLPGWKNALGAYLITPAMGSHFVMYIAKMQDNSRSELPSGDVERFIFVVTGAVSLTNGSGNSHNLMVDSYAYLPPNFQHSINCDTYATLVVFERRYAYQGDHATEMIIGSTDKQPLLETPGEIFQLRKLLPTSMAYDFNIHIMDFQPGEFLNVKEVHYNQHGLLLLEGQGIKKSFNLLTIFLNFMHPLNINYEMVTYYVNQALTPCTLFKQVMLYGWHHLCHNGMLRLANRGHAICCTKM